MEKLTPEKALENTKSLIEFQLSKVEMEVRDRERLSRRILEKLQKELDDYFTAKSHPIRCYEYATGINPFEDQKRIQELIQKTKHNIRVEEKSCWNDVQKLEWERRQLQRERAQIIFSIHLLKQNKGE